MTKKYIQDFKSKLSNGGTLAPEELQDFFSRLEGDLKDKKYGLVWESQTEQVIEQLKTNKVYLHEDESLKITQDPDNPKSNILIEGDNYEALTYLKQVNQKVDVIYIDPPYNTGNKDFIYNDRFTTKEDGFRHSQWLSFMNDRLRLARELMTDEGVIFISIDEFEFAQLKLLCDQVFGELNFIANITWDKRNPKGNSKTVSSVIEYILVYGKNKNLVDGVYVNKENAEEMVRKANSLFKKVGKIEKPTELIKVVKKYGVVGINVKDFEKEYTLEDANNEFSEWLKTKPTFTQGEKAYKLIDEEGRLYRRVSMAAPKKSNNMTPLIHPDTGKPCPVPRTGWRNKPETMEELLRGGLVDFGHDETTQPNRKYFLTENMKESLRDLISYAGKGVDDLMPLGFSFETFDNPKPLWLIKRLIEPFKPDATVLDFFAGSGTTGHAVLGLNKEDGGNRQFILVTNNENNIARGITYERNKRVIEGYTTPKGKDVPGIPSNLAYYKTKQVSKYDIDFDEVILQHIIPTIQLTEGVYSRTQHSPHTTQLGDSIFIFNQYMVEDDEIDTLVGLVKDEDILYIQEGQVEYIKTKLPEGVVYKYLEDVLPTNR